MNPGEEGVKRNLHHLIFQARHWNQGYAKMLRDHWYFKIRIPQDTTHRIIHSRLHDIVMPGGSLCKSAYQHLLDAEKAGQIQPTDTPQQRLTWLIREWKNEPRIEVTVAELIYQRVLFDEYYSDYKYLKRHQSESSSGEA